MKVLQVEKKMIDPGLILFIIGMCMCIFGGYAWLTKDTQASVRNVKLTEDILNRVDDSIKKSDAVDNKLSEAVVAFEREIGQTNLAIKAAAENSKNISVNLPHSIQFNVVYEPKVKAMVKPITLPPLPKTLKKSNLRARENN